MVRAFMFLVLFCWLFLLKSCRRYQVSSGGEQEEILLSSKYLRWRKVVPYSALPFLQSLLSSDYKSQVVMGAS